MLRVIADRENKIHTLITTEYINGDISRNCSIRDATIKTNFIISIPNYEFLTGRKLSHPSGVQNATRINVGGHGLNIFTN